MTMIRLGDVRSLAVLVTALVVATSGAADAALAAPRTESADVTPADAATGECDPTDAVQTTTGAGTTTAGSAAGGTGTGAAAGDAVPVAVDRADAAGASGSPVTVWLAGDSTMARGSSPCPTGWGSQFAAFFDTDVTVVNSAVGGRSVQTWLHEPNVTSTRDGSGECVVDPQAFSQRWLAMLDPVTGMQAGDYLFVQFGINDGDTNCPRHVGSARYRELLGLMVEAAQERGAHPVLVTPVAMIRCSGATAVGNRGFVTETRDVAVATGVPLVDLNASSVALYNTLGLCPDNDDYTSGAAGDFFCDDHTHFEAAGARRIAGLVADALREQGIGLGTHLVQDPVPTAIV